MGHIEKNMSRDIIITEPYDIGADTGLKCPLSGKPLIYNGDLKFYPLGGLGYLEYKINIFDFLNGNKMYTINYEKMENMLFSNILGFSEEIRKNVWSGANLIIKSFKGTQDRKLYFRLNDDLTWSTLINVCYKYINANTPIEEIQKIIDEDNLDYEKIKAEYLTNPDGKIFSFRVNSTLFNSDSIKVTPMAEPKTNLFYIDNIIK